MKKIKKKKGKVKKLSDEEKKARREKRFLNKKIVSLFETAGFQHIKTADKNLKFHDGNCEIDNIFIYDNIIIISEDTITSTKNLKDHIRRKKELTDIIESNKKEFHDLIATVFSKEINEKGIDFNKYSIDRYIYNYIYFSKNKTNLTKIDLERYNPLRVCEYETLRYFTMIKNAIKISVKYELFKYLEIDESQMGNYTSDEPTSKIRFPIICPADHTAQKEGVHVVSFMLSAQLLIKNGYVLRKDNWQIRSTVYQRLLQPKRVKSIREYVAKNGTAFLNNVIIGLPDGTQIFKKEYKESIPTDVPIRIEDVKEYGEYSITLPNKFNSLCIIDGQHRIYAHHEANDKFEKIMSRLRENLHLLVTGLIFPKKMSDLDRSAFASDVFIDINDNTRRVPAEVLLHIKTFKNPFSDVAIARMVIERLNIIPNGVFENRLQISSLDSLGIKTSSIIQFALKYLVTLTPSEGNLSLVNFISKEQLNRLNNEDTDALQEYVDESASFINMYFSALKHIRIEDWNDPGSRILKITSLNGFIMALNKSLENFGKCDFEFYRQAFTRMNVDFSKDEFGFASSQYRKFSVKLINQIFDIRKF